MKILRIYIAVILLLCSLAGGAQVRPDQFPLQTNITGTNFEVYSQYGGVNTKTLPIYMKEYFVPNVDSSWQAFTFTDSIGVVDSLRMMFLKDNRGRVWYVDADGDALLLKDTAQAVGNVYALATLADTSTVASPVEGDIAVVGADTLLFYETYWLIFSANDNKGLFDVVNNGDTIRVDTVYLISPLSWLVGTNYLYVSSSHTSSTIFGVNTLSGSGVQGQSISGPGAWGGSNSGSGIEGQSGTGPAVKGTTFLGDVVGELVHVAVDSNRMLGSVKIDRGTSGTVEVGMGAGMEVLLEDAAAASVSAGLMGVELADPTAAGFTADFGIDLADSTALTRRVTVSGATGQAVLHGYANNALNNPDSLLYFTGVDNRGYLWTAPAAGFLDSLGGVTGSGTAGTLPIWSSANALGNSSLTESGQVLSSSLTGALKLPAGTDAQDPVWVNGMIRYNTTTAGFQGYNGVERYLPWADADNWSNTAIPFSNGSQLTTDVTKFFFDDSNDKLGVTLARIGTTGLTSSNSALLHIESNSTSWSPLLAKLTFSNTFRSTIRSWNTGVDSWNMMVINPYTMTKPTLYLGLDGLSAGIPITTRKEIIKMGYSRDENNQGGTFQNPNAGMSISWRYQSKTGLNAQEYDAGYINMEVADTSTLGLNKTQLEIAAHYNGSQIEVAKFRGDYNVFPVYGDGTVTGTKTFSAAWDVDGRFIERAYSWAEMYIDDADPDTIAITAGSPADGTDWLDGDTTTTFTVSGGRITYTGTETATFDIDFSGEIDASTNLTASVWLYKSNSAIAGTKRRQAITAATAENVSTGCLVSLATNDYIEVFFDTSTNGSVYINNASLKVKKL